jgi:DNA polymerase III sliding clamp (beta) subunit (PCNA family)
LTGKFPNVDVLLDAHTDSAPSAAFNGTYLKQMNDAAGSSEVLVAHWNGEEKPAYFTTPGDDAFVGLLMPVRL